MRKQANRKQNNFALFCSFPDMKADCPTNWGPRQFLFPKTLALTLFTNKPYYEFIQLSASLIPSPRKLCINTVAPETLPYLSFILPLIDVSFSLSTRDYSV